jgi:hypothetical protein
MITFVCSKCQAEKDSSLFKKAKQRKSGLSSWCKQCHSDDQSARAKANRPQQNANNAAYKKRYHDRLIASRKHCKALRRARKRNATLGTGYNAEIRSFYANCPEGMVVDHIIPLSHPLVNGLHIPSNLQYLPRLVNQQKSNIFDGTWSNGDWDRDWSVMDNRFNDYPHHEFKPEEEL